MQQTLWTWTRWVGVAICFLLLASTARSASLSFDNSGIFTGNLSYSPGGTLQGSAIVFDRIQGIDTPYVGTVNCEGCTLTFETGTVSPFAATPPTFMWGGGGSFVLEGTVKDGATTVAAGVLLSGEWSDPVFGSVGGSTLSILGGNNPGASTGLALDLAAFFGVSSDLEDFAFTAIAIVPENTDLAAGFSLDVAEADLQSAVVPVPEPASGLLLFLGLVGLGGWSWRRVKHSQI